MNRYVAALLTALSLAVSIGAAQAQGPAARFQSCLDCPPIEQDCACDNCYTEKADTCEVCLIAPCLDCPPASTVVYADTVFGNANFFGLAVYFNRPPCLLCPPATGQPFHLRRSTI